MQIRTPTLDLSLVTKTHNPHSDQIRTAVDPPPTEERYATNSDGESLPPSPGTADTGVSFPVAESRDNYSALSRVAQQPDDTLVIPRRAYKTSDYGPARSTYG